MSRPRGWDRVGVPVFAGARPERTVTLAALAGRRGFAGALADVTGVSPGSREAAMTVLHRALTAAGAAVLAPLAVDGVALSVAPGEVGLVMPDPGEVAGVWVGRHQRPELLRPAAHAGTQVMRLLDGVTTRVREATGLPSRAVARVVSQALEARCRGLAGTRPGDAPPGWYDEFRVAAGLPPVAWRRMAVRPDDGPVVLADVPPVCCVLAPSAGAASCPGCPQHRRGQREVVFGEWLAGLDDTAFREVTGRPRVRGRVPHAA